jgi:hypothetical protein
LLKYVRDGKDDPDVIVFHGDPVDCPRPHSLFVPFRQASSRSPGDVLSGDVDSVSEALILKDKLRPLVSFLGTLKRTLKHVVPFGELDMLLLDIVARDVRGFVALH